MAGKLEIHGEQQGEKTHYENIGIVFNRVDGK